MSHTNNPNVAMDKFVASSAVLMGEVRKLIIDVQNKSFPASQALKAIDMIVEKTKKHCEILSFGINDQCILDANRVLMEPLYEGFEKARQEILKVYRQQN